jgi:hypothetical protein
MASDDCVKQIATSILSTEPTTEQQKCVLEKMGPVALNHLCPEGQILPQLEVYFRYENLVKQFDDFPQSKYRKALIKEWIEIGYYHDWDVKVGLNEIEAEAYACRERTESEK